MLDQLASLCGEAGHALRIDFHSLELRPVPLSLREWALVLAPSGEDRSLAEAGYNRRREECSRAAARLGARSLREVSRADAQLLPEPLRSRTLHVIDENERVDAMVTCLLADRIDDAGAILSASHRSLRDLYDVSTPGVEATVRRLLAEGAAGARIMGGGFGGQVLALFPPGSRPRPPALEVRPASGARLLDA
jgi:galactokinase